MPKAPAPSRERTWNRPTWPIRAVPGADPARAVSPDRADRREEEAGAAVDEHARAVARAICNVQNLLDPELVVLGGGIGGRSDFLELVRAHVRELRDHPPVVVSSALGEWAGAVGAAELALGETERAAAHA